LIKKQFTVNCTSLLLIYFLLHSTFFKGKVKSGIFGEFYCSFLRGLLKKRGGLLWLGIITSTLKVIMDP